MEFTIDKIAKEVAEKALDEITYEGKTLREWVEIIVKQDCISREDAKNLFLDGTEGYDCRGFTRMEIGEMLDELPSVTPTRPIEQEPRQGHWIKVTNDRGGHECDVCHYYAPSFQDGDEYLSAFCPNCGAYMRKAR